MPPDRYRREQAGAKRKTLNSYFYFEKELVLAVLHYYYRLARNELIRRVESQELRPSRCSVLRMYLTGPNVDSTLHETEYIS